MSASNVAAIPNVSIVVQPSPIPPLHQPRKIDDQYEKIIENIGTQGKDHRAIVKSALDFYRRRFELIHSLHNNYSTQCIQLKQHLDALKNPTQAVNDKNTEFGQVESNSSIAQTVGAVGVAATTIAAGVTLLTTLPVSGPILLVAGGISGGTAVFAHVVKSNAETHKKDTSKLVSETENLINEAEKTLRSIETSAEIENVSPDAPSQAEIAALVKILDSKIKTSIKKPDVFSETFKSEEKHAIGFLINAIRENSEKEARIRKKIETLDGKIAAIVSQRRLLNEASKANPTTSSLPSNPLRVFQNWFNKRKDVPESKEDSDAKKAKKE